MDAATASRLAAGDRSLLAAIGSTPLVDVTALLDGVDGVARDVRLLAKLESANPTGSVKDRIALAMVRDALDSGSLAPGQAMLEPTSGNTGISLAMVARVLGLRLRVVMPDNVTAERVHLLDLLGAEVVPSPGSEGSNGAVRLAKQLLADDPSLFSPMQYENPANPRAHYEGTGPEILQQADGQVDAFVAGLGTGGTLTGVGRRLRETLGDRVQVVAAEPLPGDAVMGLRSLDEGYVPPVLDASLLDRRLLVRNADAVRGMRRLLDAGIFAGVSSGATLHVATRMACEVGEGGTVVFLVADSGWRYLSAGLWNEDVDGTAERMEDGHWW